MQVNLVLCKAMLPNLYKGFVSVRLDKLGAGGPLMQLSRCLTKQPDSITHLKMFSQGNIRNPHRLIDLRFVLALHGVCVLLRVAWACPCSAPAF